MHHACRSLIEARRLLLLVLLVMGCRSAVPVPINELAVPAGPESRLMVFAPHPDDETLAAGGLIQRVLASGSAVQIVVMTSGDALAEGVKAAGLSQRPSAADFRTYGNLREHETTAAMALVGIDRAKIKFLGFPDGGLCMIASKYLSTRGTTFESPYTRRDEPPAAEQVVRDVKYRGADIQREIEAIITAFVPTLIVLPHAEDRHPDHCATSIFVRAALDAVNSGRGNAPTPRVINYVIHYDDWPHLDEEAASPMRPPSAFPKDEGGWRTLTLTRPEALVKQRAITTYKSQMAVMSGFLRAFARPNELFVEGPVASPECWCDDTHVATETPPELYRRRRAEHR